MLKPTFFVFTSYVVALTLIDSTSGRFIDPTKGGFIDPTKGGFIDPTAGG